MLKKNTSLEKLRLKGHVLNRGAVALGEALKENCTLKQLRLDGNYVGEEGAKALADGVRQNESARTFYFGQRP